MNTEKSGKLANELDFIKDFPPQSYEEWKKKVLADLKDKPFEKLITKSYENIDINPIYIFDFEKDKLENQNYPSLPNFVRSANATGILRGWLTAQNLYAESAAEYNSNIKHDLNYGLNSINIKLRSNTFVKTFEDYFSFDLKSLSEIETALDGINLEELPIFVFSSFPDYDFLNSLEKYYSKYKIDVNKTEGGVEIDPLTEAVSIGMLPNNTFTLSEKIVAFFGKIKNTFPEFSVINVKANNFLNAGGGRVCELAFALSAAVEYLNLLSEKFKPDEIVKRIRFTFSLTPFFFADIAKLRAFRPLWEKVISEFGVNNSNYSLNVLGESSTFYRTVAEPYSNLLRSTAEAFAGIIANVQAINIIPFDATFRKPNDFSRRLARNSQLVLTEESFLNRVIDSAGGSYYVENLTEEFANKSWDLFKQMENSGGFLKAVESGFVSEKINSVRNKKFRDFDKRKLISIGINAYVKPDENIPNEITPLTKEEIKEQIGGDYSFSVENTPLNFERLSNRYEKFRRKVLNAGNRKIELVGIGKLSDYKARADFSRSLFETGGFNVIYPKKGNNSSEEAIEQILNSANRIFVLCSSDKIYPDYVCEILNQVKSKSVNKIIFLAGKPKEFVEEFSECGIDDFLFAGMDAFSFLVNLFENQIWNENGKA